MRISVVSIAFFALAVAFFGLASVVQAHGLFIFPNEDQSQEQQDKDEFECIRIARDQSGFDPMGTPTATEAMPETAGGAGRGAVGGALLGTAVGAGTGLGIDYLINEGVELVQREPLEAELEAALAATQREWQLAFEQSLGEAIGVWFGDTLQLLVRFER